MKSRLPDHVIEQFSPENTIDMDAYVDNCRCACRSHFTIKDGLLNVHGEPIFDRLLVDGNLILPDDSELQRLPDLLAVTGTININDCSGLKIMPSKMYAGESIHMDRINVRDLPDTMVAAKAISMRDCPNVLTIPHGTKVNSLNAAGCSKLTNIASGLEFLSLDLSGTPITELPADLTIKNELKLRYCSELGQIGEGVTVGRAIDVRDCDMLFTLPNSIQPDIVITDGMMVAYDRVVVPSMTAEEASMCLGFKAIEAFPHRHFKNVERMQDPVTSVDRYAKGSLRGRAVGVLKTNSPFRWQPDFFRRLIARLNERDTAVFSGTVQVKRLL